MIKKIKLFLEDVEFKKKDIYYTKLINSAATAWFKNVKPISFDNKDLEQIKKLIDFKLTNALFDVDYLYNYLEINKGVIYSLRRDFYLITLGNQKKTSNYYCKGFPNLLKFIREKLVIK